MFNHVMFIDSNQHCVFCMNCVRNCPNGSPQMNLRLPARELWVSLNARPEVGRFVALLLGLLVALMLIHHGEQQPHRVLSPLLEEHRFTFVTGVLGLSAALSFALLWLVTRRLGRSADSAAAARFWQRVVAWVPLVTAGFVCYQLAFVPGLNGLQAMLSYRPVDGQTSRAVLFSLLSAAQLSVLLAGLVTTVGTLWKLWQTGEGGPTKGWVRTVSLAGVLAYWTIFLVLMLRPGWLTI
jgi:ferredoxin